jgi:2'-5' RNA ligase
VTGGSATPPGRRGRGRAGSPRARLFVALDLPEPVRAAIERWRGRTLAGRDELRPASTATLHVTLCFLGWRAEKDVPRIAEVTSAACGGLTPARLVARTLEPVPPRRPRLFALDLEDVDGSARTLQARVAEALAAARMFEPERRPFWPHVTLARVKRGWRASPLDGVDPPPAEPFEASEVTLYRSTLRPQGALYEPLARTVLGG